LDEELMRLALAEAERGRGRTSPNPIVGAVVVRAGQVIARGHHERAGQPHAEVNALRAAGRRARGADLYVTLEPCNHFGRTPPCTDALIEAGVRRVVIGMSDPNPQVAGGGAIKLRRAGLRVAMGVLGDECRAANEAWIKLVVSGVPWIVLKAAVTLDGMLAASSGDSHWVTSAPARALVHRYRDELDAVLVGVGTALADDPQLTARLPDARNPQRVVVDSGLRLPPSARVLPAIVACRRDAPAARARALERRGAELLRCRSSRAGIDLGDLFEKLGARGIASVLVEGGAAIHGSLLAARLWDELRLFVAPKVLGRGLSWAALAPKKRIADALQVGALSAESVGEDLLIRAKNPKTR
jgi:diaminohydroxyphosphoribosylaminopyrimidine deaminase/5-amino-6-(5-phosphoribosylamino)uracil reductase